MRFPDANRLRALEARARMMGVSSFPHTEVMRETHDANR
jgi:hypothetical protein